MKEISLTRALNEVKLTEKKIQAVNAKNKGWIVTTKNGKLQNAQFDNIEQFNASVKADKQKLKDLIKYRNDVKSKLLTANVVTTIIIAGETLTIAEAIDRKNFASTEMYLYRDMNRDVDMAVNMFETQQTDLDTKVEVTINKALEGDGKKDPAVIKGIEDSVRANNKLVLEDKNNMRTWITDKMESLSEFLNEVDFSLSEVNAKTTIEVEG